MRPAISASTRSSDQANTSAMPSTVFCEYRWPAPGARSDKTRKTRSRRSSSFCTSSSLRFRAGPDTPSRTTKRWWHCEQRPAAVAPRWQCRQNGVPHFTQRTVKARAPRHRQSTIPTRTKTPIAPTNRLTRAAPTSGARGRPVPLPAAFFCRMAAGVPANFVHRSSSSRPMSTTA